MNKTVPFETLDLQNLPGRSLYLQGITQKNYAETQKISDSLKAVKRINYLQTTRLLRIENILGRAMDAVGSHNNRTFGPTEAELREVLNTLSKIEADPSENESKGIDLLAHKLEVPRDSVLKVFEARALGYLTDDYVLKKKTSSCIDISMKRMNIVYQLKFRDRICRAFSMMEQAMIIFCSQPDGKIFMKQICYGLNVAEACLENIRATDKTSEAFEDSMRYLFFGWSLYIGKLLEFSKKIYFDGDTSEDAVKEKLKTINIGDKFIPLDNFELKPVPYRVPDYLLTTDEEIKNLYHKILEYNMKMRKFRPLNLRNEKNSYDVMQRVMDYALKMFPTLRPQSTAAAS